MTQTLSSGTAAITAPTLNLNTSSTGNTSIGNSTGAITLTGHTTIEGVTSTGATGTGKFVFDTSPTLVTPNLGTPSALVGTNITGTAAGLTAGNVTTNANLTGAVTSSGNATSLGSFSSANLSGALTDETGSGAAVFGTSPAITTSLTTGSTTFALLNTTATTLNIGGAATTINFGAAGATVTGGGAFTLNSGAATALTLDSGTTGTVNLGTSNNAKTINIGTGTAGNTIHIGDNNTTADTITIGSALDALSLASTGLNVTTGGALTGVASIDTISTSATALTFAGAGTIASTSTNALSFNSAVTTGTTTSSAFAFNPSAVSSGTGLYLASSTLTSGLLMNLQVSGTAAAASQTALNILTAGANATNAITTYGAQISNTHTNATSGTNVGLYLNASGATTANYGLIVNAGNVGIGTTTPSRTLDVTGDWGGNVVTTSTTDSTTTSTISTKALAYYVESSDTSGNCSTGTKTFNITGLSNTEGSYAFIVSKATDGGCNSGTLTLTVQINGSTISTVANGNTGGTVTENYLVAYINAGWRILGTPSTADGADLAENYYTMDDTINAGDVVTIDSSLPSGVKKSIGIDDKKVIGIVSTSPGMVLDDASGMGNGRAVPVALAGRVPVKVSTENGAIEYGDYLTSSSVPGVAMKADGAGLIIGQAISSYSGSDVGMVIVIVKNFEFGDTTVLLGNVSPKLNADGTDNGLSTLVATIQAEASRNPVTVIGQKISDGKQFLTDFVAARVTAIRGYFDEVFAKKIHTEEICVKKSDGTEVCVNGDQINNMINGSANVSSVIPPAPVPAPDPVVVPTPQPTPNPTSTVDPVSTSNPIPAPTPVSDSTPVVVPAPDSVPAPAPAPDLLPTTQ